MMRPPSSPALHTAQSPDRHCTQAPSETTAKSARDSRARESLAFTDQQKMDRVIERLKEEAAGLGANGILLEGVGD
jgi:hypothetical protein